MKLGRRFHRGPEATEGGRPTGGGDKSRATIFTAADAAKAADTHITRGKSGPPSMSVAAATSAMRQR